MRADLATFPQWRQPGAEHRHFLDNGRGMEFSILIYRGDIDDFMAELQTGEVGLEPPAARSATLDIMAACVAKRAPAGR